MDFIERLREQLNVDQGALPWAFGFDPETDSPADLAVRKLFKPEELLAISKHNPFLKERNDAIRHIAATGLPYLAITRLTGLSRASIIRIIQHQCRL